VEEVPPAGVRGVLALLVGVRVRMVRTREASWMVKSRERCGFSAGWKSEGGRLVWGQSDSSREEVGLGPLRQARAELR